MNKDEKKSVGTSTASDLSFIKSEMSRVKQVAIALNDDQKTFIRGLINKDLNDTELMMFLNYANKVKLNPFTGEIRAVVYNKNKPEKRTVSVIVARDGKRRVAEETKELTNITTEAIYVRDEETPVYEIDPETGTQKIVPSKMVKKVVRVQPWEGGKLWGATSTVTRGEKKFTAVVPFAEYTTSENLWASKPSTMIKKVAESQALSAAFPEILSGAYDEAEMSVPLNTSAGELPASPDDSKPATDQQMQILAQLSPETIDENTEYTFGEAKKLIMELSLKKTAKKGAQE